MVVGKERVQVCKGDLGVCLDEARAFFDVAEEISSFDRLMPPTRFTYPIIVNYAFCCELYLKALMIERSGVNEFAKGHHLRELFLRLDEADQQAIKSAYRPDLCNWDFDDAIGEFDNVFVDWRYAFDEGSGDAVITVFEFVKFAEALRKYAEDVIASNHPC